MQRRLLICVLGLLGTLAVAPSAVSAQNAESTPHFSDTGCQRYTDSVSRLYGAAFGRSADADGFDYWRLEYQLGNHSLSSMAVFFAESPEFEATYGALDNEGFVRRMYRNVLGREGDAGGIQFWLGELDGRMARGTLLLRFSESPENVAITGTIEPSLGFYNSGLDRPFSCVPTDDVRSFETPSGNITCAVDSATEVVRCDVRSHSWVATGGANCPFDFGDSVFVDRMSVGFGCISDAIGPPMAQPGYATMIVTDTIDCAIETTGVRCTNRNGRGFNVARARVDFF